MHDSLKPAQSMLTSGVVYLCTWSIQTDHDRLQAIKIANGKAPDDSSLAISWLVTSFPSAVHCEHMLQWYSYGAHTCDWVYKLAGAACHVEMVDSTQKALQHQPEIGVVKQLMGRRLMHVQLE